MTEEEFKSVKAGDKLVLTASADYAPYPGGGKHIGYVATTYGKLTLEAIDNLELVKVDRRLPDYRNVFKVGERVKVVGFKGLVFGGGVDLTLFKDMIGIVSARNIAPNDHDRDMLKDGIFTSEVYVDFDDQKDLLVSPCCLVKAGVRYAVSSDADEYIVVDRDDSSYKALCSFSRSIPNAYGLACAACNKMNDDGIREFEEAYGKERNRMNTIYDYTENEKGSIHRM